MRRLPGYLPLPQCTASTGRSSCCWPLAWLQPADRRLAASALWAQLLLPAAAAIITWVHVTPLWSMSGWTLLPVVLLSSPLLAISRRDALRIIMLAIAFPFVALAFSPA